MIWPLRKKMTVDYCASLIADAIGEDAKVYAQAIRNHAAENISESALEDFLPEIWKVELSILEVVLVLAKFPPKMAEQLIPMLVVGYSGLEKTEYSEAMEHYGRLLREHGAERLGVEFGKSFVSRMGVEFRTERVGVNRSALEWAIGTVIVGSFQGLLEYVSDIANKYRIV
jgi:hypothetical protein